METIAQQRQEVVRMIESIKDPEILNAVKNLLASSEKNFELKTKMVFGAKRSEEDFEAGRIFTREQVVERTNRTVNK